MRRHDEDVRRRVDVAQQHLPFEPRLDDGAARIHKAAQALQHALAALGIDPGVDQPVGVAQCRIASGDRQPRMWKLLQHGFEGLDHLESALALEVAADEQEVQVIPRLAINELGRFESGIDDLDLLRVSAPPDLQIPGPAREDVAA
jgi:hypothetical protein